MTGTRSHLADFVTSAAANAPGVRAAARTVLIDTVACMFGGVGTPLAEPVLSMVRSQFGSGDATLLDRGGLASTTVVGAAYANSHVANILDADETLLNRSHYAAAIVPSALAVAESERSSGAELLDAIAIGYEIAARVGLALPHFQLLPDGSLAHGLTGYSSAGFGAAAAAGRLLGLDAAQMDHAFGIVAKSVPVHFPWTSPSGLAAYFDLDAPPGHHKYAMFGSIAQSGVQATYLARDGYEAAPGVFEPDGGLHESFGLAEMNRDMLDAQPQWWIERAALKVWPSCRFGHPALTALSDILESTGVRPEAIDEVVITIPPFLFLEKMAAFRRPDDPARLVFSLPMAVALVIHRVAAGPLWWNLEHFNDPAVRRTAATVRYVVDEARGLELEAQLAEHGGYVGIRTTVELRVGAEVMSAESEYSTGDVFMSDRGLTRDVLRRKFATFTAEAAVTAGQGAAMFDLLWDVATAAEVADVWSPLR